MDTTLVAGIVGAVIGIVMLSLMYLYMGEELPEPRVRLRRWLSISAIASVAFALVVAAIAYSSLKKPSAPGTLVKILVVMFGAWFVMCMAALSFRDYGFPALIRSLRRIRSIPFQSTFFFMIWSNILTFSVFFIVLTVKGMPVLDLIFSSRDTGFHAAMFYLVGGIAGIVRGIVTLRGMRQRIETVLTSERVQDFQFAKQTRMVLLYKIILSGAALLFSLIVIHARWVWIATWMGDMLGFNLYAFVWAYSYEKKSGGRLSLLARLYVNMRDETGMTPLMHAVKQGHKEAVKNLLNKGADPDAADNTGRTVSDLADEAGNAEIIQLLKQAGKNKSTV